MLRQGDGARQVLSTSSRRLSSSCTAILSSRDDGADLSGYCRKSSELKAKQEAYATTPLLAEPQTYPVVVPAGAGPGSKIRVKNPQTGADVNVIVPAGVTAGGQFLVPIGDENI